MSRLHLCLAASMLALAACGEAANAPAAPAASAPAAAGPTVGQEVALLVGLVAGDLHLVSGEVVTPTGQSWTDPSGKEQSIAPPPGFAIGPTCIFVVINDDKTPVLPLEPVIVDKLQPCWAESSFSSVKLSGTVAEVRDVQLLVNNETVTLQGLVLTKIDFVTPPL
ncbi:MAG: hypothetical protein Q8R02_12280 [Hyphomonadaceae bacterium]|nr:hypothetical protein [Hyphomonadaceae bacterium]